MQTTLHNQLKYQSFKGNINSTNYSCEILKPFSHRGFPSSKYFLNQEETAITSCLPIFQLLRFLYRDDAPPPADLIPCAHEPSWRISPEGWRKNTTVTPSRLHCSFGVARYTFINNRLIFIRFWYSHKTSPCDDVVIGRYLWQDLLRPQSM